MNTLIDSSTVQTASEQQQPTILVDEAVLDEIIDLTRSAWVDVNLVELGGVRTVMFCDGPVGYGRQIGVRIGAVVHIDYGDLLTMWHGLGYMSGCDMQADIVQHVGNLDPSERVTALYFK